MTSSRQPLIAICSNLDALRTDDRQNPKFDDPHVLAGHPLESSTPFKYKARAAASWVLTTELDEKGNSTLIAEWQARHLTPSALNRIRLVRGGTVASGSSERVKVSY